MRSARLPLAALVSLAVSAGSAGAASTAPDAAEVPVDLLTAPEGVLEAVRHNYFPGDHDPTTPGGAVRWRVWARHYPEAAAWARAHHATAEWAHHHPERTRWALENPASSTFVVNHPDVLEWQAAHPAAARRARATREAHDQRAVWDELTGRTQGAVSDAAMAAAMAPEARADVVVPAPEASASSGASPRYQVIQRGGPVPKTTPRFEVRKPRSNVIARRDPPAPAPIYAPLPETVVVHETVVVPTYQPAPVVLRTTPRLRYRYRPRIVIYRGGPRWGRKHCRYRGGHRGRRPGRRHGRGHRRWW